MLDIYLHKLEITTIKLSMLFQVLGYILERILFLDLGLAVTEISKILCTPTMQSHVK